MIPRQEPTLLFQFPHQIRQFLHHALVRAKIPLLRQHHTEVEDELIAVVSLRLDTDRIAENAVTVRADLNQVTAEFLAWDHED